jgi:hypothetical protein
MAHFSIGAFDLLGESTLGVAAGFFLGADLCAALACGVGTSTRGVGGGGAALAGTAKLALQAGHSMV